MKVLLIRLTTSVCYRYASGVIAMSKVETDCLSANQYGKKAMEKFISCDARHSLFDPMKKQKLSTFTNIYQQKLQSKR